MGFGRIVRGTATDPRDVEGVSYGFVVETLWLEFVEWDNRLRLYLEQTPERVILESLDAESSEAQERSPRHYRQRRVD